MIAATLAATMAVSACGPHGGPPPRRSAPPTTGEAAPATGSASSTTAGVAAPPTGGTWLTYQANLGRTGAVSAAGPGLGRARIAWRADLGGAVYGEVLVAYGRLFAATEDNRVVALDPRTGRVVWSRSFGAPLTDVRAVAGCGDIDPLGITSTPVIDPATRTLYVVAEIHSEGAVVHHQLEGLDLATGAVEVSDDVDPPLPPGEQAVNLLQRASLALANGRVYVAYGGNFGDCGDYHGWLVAVASSGPPHETAFEVAPDGHGGAIWQSGGAPAVDARGDLYVSTGNSDPAPPTGRPDPVEYAESVVKLSPALAPQASFKDMAAGGDEDLSTGNPVLLTGGRVFAVGKTDIGYLLDATDLTQLAAIHGICGSDPDGGPAYDSATQRLFVPCRGGGIQEVNLVDDTVGPLLPGSNSTPVLAGVRLWAIQYPQGTVTEYDARTAATLQRLDVGAPVPNFASPSVGLGLLLVPTSTGVAAVSAG